MPQSTPASTGADAPARPLPPVRLATEADLDEVVRLRGVMFEGIAGPDLPTGDAWRRRCRHVLAAGLAAGTVFAVVADAPDRPGLAASVVVEVQQRLPSPWGPAGTLGYLSSVATDPEHRSQGFARAVVTAALAELDRRGVEKVELHASPMGRPLYTSLGFGPRPGGEELRLLDR